MCSTAPGSTSTPKFCYGENRENGSPLESIAGFSWNAGAQGLFGSNWLPIDSSTMTPPETLIVRFVVENNTPNTPSFNMESQNGVISVGSNYFGILGTEFQNRIGGRGILIGRTGNGILQIGFNNQTGKTFELDLSQTQTSGYSFGGNIRVFGDGTNNKAIFKFAEKMKGNIHLIGNGGASLTTIFTGSNGGLEGNIGGITSGNSAGGTLKVEFKNGSTLRGNIQTGMNAGTGGGNDFTKKEVIFKGASSATTTVMTGNIISYGSGFGGSLDKARSNHITFEQGSMMGNIQAYYDNAFRKGYNKVTFSQNGATLTGNIVAMAGTNEVIFGSMPSVESSASQSAASSKILGNIRNTLESASSASFGGTNNITFYNSGEIGQDNASNSIFVDTGTNNITFKGDGKIYSNISSMASNIFFFSGLGYRQGRNVIVFESGAQVGSDARKVTIQANAGENAITFRGNTRLHADIMADRITYESGAFSGTNNLTFSGTSNTITGNLRAKGGTNNITFSGSGASNTIVGDITATINPKFSGLGTNNLIFNNTSNSTITGNISANGGINNIGLTNLASLTINGDITVNNQNNNRSVNNLSASNSGAIAVKNITASGGTNNIRLGNSGTLTVGSITASGGSNNILIKNTSTTSMPATSTSTASTTSTTTGAATSTSTNSYIGLMGNITTNSGNNNIVFEDKIWAPSTSMDSKTGNLTTKGGTTNLVLRRTAPSTQSMPTQAISAQIPTYNITTNGGNTNIVMQGDVNVSANFTYGVSGTTNVIFASSNNNPSTNAGPNANGTPSNPSIPTITSIDNFSGATNAQNGQVLGVTYQDGVRLLLGSYTSNVGGQSIRFVEQYGDLFRKEDGSILNITTQRDTARNIDNVIVDGLAIGGLFNLVSSNAPRTYNVTLKNGSAFVGELALEPSTSHIVLKMESGSKFVLAGTGSTTATARLQTLDLRNVTPIDVNQVLDNTFMQTNTIINIANDGNDNFTAPNREWFRLLEIGGTAPTQSSSSNGSQPAAQSSTSSGQGLLGSNGLFMVYVNPKANQSNVTLGRPNGTTSGGSSDSNTTHNQHTKTNYQNVYADRIIVHSGNKGTNYIQPVLDSSTVLSEVRYHGGGAEIAGNIAVATVKGVNGDRVTNFLAQDSLQGFDVIGTTLTSQVTDVTGKADASGGYTTYFINGLGSKGASVANQMASAAALGANYNLYLANFNSLNKRMGELRENANSQGAWARVFHGMQTTSFALQTKALYTTLQAGYDYAFGLNGANNYLGFALSYANSHTKTADIADINTDLRGLRNVVSNGVEVAIYNAYVEDGASKETRFKNGLYTDTILKFSFIKSSFNLLNQTQTYDTDNFAFSFSQELGYRFLFGEHKEFILDPQVEVTLGYLDQSNFRQTLGTAYLDGVQEGIFTLRTRVGSSFGYDFRKYTQDRGFGAKVYLGTYFVGDYIAGGNVSLTSNLRTFVSLSPLASTTRFVMNVGTQFSIKDHHRIYFDFERSFGGLITTDYQVNLGYRYSFGTSKYTPYQQAYTLDSSSALKEIAPTKGYYIQLISDKKDKLSKKELKILKKFGDNLKTQSTTQGGQTAYTYLYGPFENQQEAQQAKDNDLFKSIQDLKSSGEIIVVE